MTRDEVLEHYKTHQAVADALGIARPCVTQWGKRVPPLRQLQLEILTRGRLKADPEVRRPAT